MLKSLCQTYVKRATELSLKGKKRDDDLIAYMAGAYAALSHAKLYEDADHVGAVNACVFAFRGYAECERLAKGVDHGQG